MGKILKKMRRSRNPLLRKLHRLIQELKPLCIVPFFYLFRIFPLQNKVIASAFNGRIYGDNPACIYEALHNMDPSLDLVWVRSKDIDFPVPEYVRTVAPEQHLRIVFEYATAKVWLETHRLRHTTRKRRGQLFIETWHGGLGVKKVDADVAKYRADNFMMRDDACTARLADLFLSNSDHLNNVYHTAIGYYGPIWKCGYPRSDILIAPKAERRASVRDHFSLSADCRILLYAPTFRDGFLKNGVDPSVYDVDFSSVFSTLQERFGGEWCILVRHHPYLRSIVGSIDVGLPFVKDAMDYPDMQELICGSDLLLTDYSSCMFDAAIAGIPAMTLCLDFSTFTRQRDGVYFDMRSLPFPFAQSNTELLEHLRNLSESRFEQEWIAFSQRTGLMESGHAAQDVADLIFSFLQGDSTRLDAVISSINSQTDQKKSSL